MRCSNVLGVKYACRLVLLAHVSILIPLATAAIPEDWKKTPYAHEATNRPLRDFMEDLVQTLGLRLQIDGQLQGMVHGKRRSDSLKAFVERLALEHRFQWFVYNNTLYISSLDQQTSERLEVADNTIADLKQALTQMGLFDDRFGWGELPDLGVVLVSGPKRYIEHIKQFSRTRTEPVDKQEVLAFALQFANAGDRQIDYRGEKLTVAGIASLLRGLLDAKSSTYSGLEPSALTHASLAGAAPQPGNPFSNSPPGSPQSTRAPTAGSRVRVEADVRNNSVLIYDSRKRQALYQTLINQLDTPRKLVEIDAVILDINRTQLKQLGMNWGFQNRRFQVNQNNLPGAGYSSFSAVRIDRFSASFPTWYSPSLSINSIC